MIYVASSWRNAFYDAVHEQLTAHGFNPYNWKDHGFNWREVAAASGIRCGTTPDTSPSVSGQEMADFLAHERSIEHFKRDKDAMDQAEVCVLVLPCGRSAHSEFGYMVGQGKPAVVLQPISPEPVLVEPELLYGLADSIVATTADLINALERLMG